MGWSDGLGGLTLPGIINNSTGGRNESNKSNLRVAADPYARVRNQLINWLTGDPSKGETSGQIGQPGQSYQGEMVAPLSEYENKSFDFLRQYGEQGANSSETMNNARGEINKTLTNQYDPTTSPYYQAVKAQAAVNLQDTQKNIANNAAGGGRYWTGARLAEQGDAARDSELGLNTMLGGMAEKERQNRLNVLPQALAFGQNEQNLPLQQAGAYQALGSLPRSIQQAGDTANQNEWLRSQVEYPLEIGRLAAGVQTPPTYQQKPPSAMEQLLGIGGQAAGMWGMSKLLPVLMCWVAAEIFGGWNHPKTNAARYFVNNMAPVWFRDFYIKHGERIAEYIHDKPILKMALRPLFEVFSYLGRTSMAQIGVV